MVEPYFNQCNYKSCSRNRSVTQDFIFYFFFLKKKSENGKWLNNYLTQIIEVYFLYRKNTNAFYQHIWKNQEFTKV